MNSENLIKKLKNQIVEQDNLLCFKNGIYDLDKSKFTEYQTQDIKDMRNVEINYIEYDKAPLKDEVMEFINQVIPNQDICNYTLKLLSSFLSNDKGEKLFHIWTGCGSNGISSLLELYEKTIGKYFSKLPQKVLFKTESNTNTLVDELRDGKRFICINLNLKNEKRDIDLNKIKGVCFHRGNKLVLKSDRLPNISSEEKEILNSCRIVPFLSVFKENPDPNKKNEFLINYEIAYNFTKWSESFMSILLKYFKIYKDEGLEPPDEITFNTSNYKKDIFTLFIDENIIECDSTENILSITEIYYRFRNWFKIHNPEKKIIPQRKEFISFLDSKFEKCDKGWRCVKFAFDSDSDSDLDILLD